MGAQRSSIAIVFKACIDDDDHHLRLERSATYKAIVLLASSFWKTPDNF